MKLKKINSMRGKKRAKKTRKGCKKEKEEQERKREREVALSFGSANE